MAETTDAMNRNAASSSGGSRSIDDIERDIQQTQSEMSRTIDEIQYRLSPETIKRKAKVRMKQNSRKLMDRIKQNPGAAAVIGLGTWMLFRDRGDSGDDYSLHEHVYEDAGYCGVCGVVIDIEEPSRTDRMRGKARQASSRASHAAHEAGDKVSHAAHDARDRVSETAHRAAEATSDFGHRMSERAGRMAGRTSRATRRTADRLEDNPLMLGALGIAVGAIVGGLIPESDREREMFGETRDRTFDRARGMAREKVEQVRHVAEAAKDAAVEEGKNAARRENLTGGGTDTRSTSSDFRTGAAGTPGLDRDRI